MRHEFLPAIIPYVIREEDCDHPVHWLRREYGDELFYPKALLSYVHWAKTPWPWNEEDEYTTFGDSGGYSVITRGESVDPTRVMRWQLRNCSRGVMLDIPPYRRGSTIQFSGSAADFWDISMKLTLRNVHRGRDAYMAALDAGSKFRWWGVVQGESLSQMDEWFSAVSEIYPFDTEGEGWALAPKPSTDVLSVVRYLRFARSVGIRNIHLLQVTSATILGVVFALARQSGAFDLITYDSATATRCAVNRNAMYRDGYRLVMVRQKGNYEGAVHDLIMRSENAVAEAYRASFPQTNAAWPHYVLLFNHQAMRETFDHLWEEAGRDPETVLRACTGKKYGSVVREWSGEVEHFKTQNKTVSIFQRLE